MSPTRSESHSISSTIPADLPARQQHRAYGKQPRSFRQAKIRLLPQLTQFSNIPGGAEGRGSPSSEECITCPAVQREVSTPPSRLRVQTNSIAPLDAPGQQLWLGRDARSVGGTAPVLDVGDLAVVRGPPVASAHRSVKIAECLRLHRMPFVLDTGYERAALRLVQDFRRPTTFPNQCFSPI